MKELSVNKAFRDVMEVEELLAQVCKRIIERKKCFRARACARQAINTIAINTLDIPHGKNLFARRPEAVRAP